MVTEARIHLPGARSGGTRRAKRPATPTLGTEERLCVQAGSRVQGKEGEREDGQVWQEHGQETEDPEDVAEGCC